MGWFRGFSKKRSGNKGFQPQKNATALQTFILEPILTPSGIIDSSDDSHTSLVLDVDTPTLPEVHLAETHPTDTTDTSHVSSVETHPVSQVDLNSHPLTDPTHSDVLATHTVDDSISDLDLDHLAFFDPTDTTNHSGNVAETTDIHPTMVNETHDTDIIHSTDISEPTSDDVSHPLEQESSTTENHTITDASSDSDGDVTVNHDRTTTEIAIASPTSEHSITNTQLHTTDTSTDTFSHPLAQHTESADTTNTHSTTDNVTDKLPETTATDNTHSTTDDVTDNLPPITDIPPIESSHRTEFSSGVFTVGETGEVGVDFLFDGGGYKGELAIFSLKDMENLTPGSAEFIKEAATRALSDSEFGHIVISDITEGAKFNSSDNSGVYAGVNTVKMTAGDEFGVMLVPNGKVQQVFDNPKVGGSLRPLFSMVTANPNDQFHIGQIADVTGDGNTFVMEDLRVDTGSDRDYNDIIFQVRGATGKAIHLDEVIAPGKDWRDSDMGQALIAYAEPYVTPDVTYDSGVDDIGVVNHSGDSGSILPTDSASSDNHADTSTTDVIHSDNSGSISHQDVANSDNNPSSSTTDISHLDNSVGTSENDITNSDNNASVQHSDSSNLHPTTESSTTTSSSANSVTNVSSVKVVESAIAPDTSHPHTVTETVAKVPVVEAPKVTESSIAPDTSHPHTVTETVAKVPVVEAPKVVESAISPDTTTHITVTETVAKVPVVEAPKIVESAISPDTTTHITVTETVAKVPAVENPKVTESALASNTSHPNTVTETVAKVPSVEPTKVVESALAPDTTTHTTANESVVKVGSVEPAKVVETVIAPDHSSTTTTTNVTSAVTSTSTVEHSTVVTTSTTQTPSAVNNNSTTPTSGTASPTEVAHSTQTTTTATTSSTVATTQTAPPVQQPPVKAAVPKPPVTFDFPKANQPLVGVIDTGFSANNPDIDYSQIKSGHDYIGNDANSLVQPNEGNNPGTQALGIIAAKQNNGIGINGINDDAPLWVGRAEVSSDQWAQSLMEFVDAAKASKQPNAVVNLSFNLTNLDGTPRFELTGAERAALAYAQHNNVLIVASAGDNPGQISALGKAGLEFDNIITVGAAERVNNSVALSKAFAGADYSGSGAGLDIVADGGSAEQPITVTSGEGTAKEFGTSVATAKVTGAASQVWAANPKLNFTQVIDILKRTATDLGKPNWDADTGAGLLNIAAAVTLAKVTTPEPYTVKPGQQTITDNFISQNNAGKQLPGDPAHPAVTPPGIPRTTVDQGANDLSGTRIRISATEDVIDQVSSIDPIDVYRGASRELAGAKFKVLTGQAVVSILSPSGQVLSQQVLSPGTHFLQMPANAPEEVLLKITPHGGDATYVLQGFEAERNEPFDINLEFESPLTASQQQIMQAAARSVASLIGKGLPSAVVDGKIIDDVNIKVSTANLDGASGTQAQTKIDFMRYGTLLPAQSITQFDAADVAELERSGELFSVAQHEFLHALGFGNLWEAKGLVDYAGTPLAQYNGKQAVEEFSKLGGATNYVPLETEGDGSADLHWNEALFQNEVMTFDLGSQPGENGQVTSPISAVTIGSLADLGYQVNQNQATPKWGLFGEQFNPANVTEEWLEEQWKRQAEVDPRLRNEGEINLSTVDPATVAPEIWAHAERGPDGEYYDWEKYVVSIPGDGFSMIAQRTMGSGSYANWKWIADRNGVYDAPYWVYLGNTIQIPVHRPNYEQEQEAERQRREQELREQQEREARERQEAEDRLKNDQAEQERLQQELDRLRREAEAHQQELEEQERRLREELEQRRRQEEWEREQARLAELRRQAEIARQQGKGGLDWYLAKPLPEFGPVDPFETSLTGETVGNLVPDDYYRFTLSRGGRITAELVKLLADADLVLYDARNEPIAYSMREGITDEQIIADLIPGTYMLRVNSPKGVTTDYDLVVKFQHKLSATQTQPLPPGWRPTSIGGNPKTPLHANPTEANPLRGFLHPLNGSGTVTQGNGGSTSHTGRSQYAYDFGVPIGTPVYAMRSGTVVAVVDKYPDTGGGYENRNNFNYVLIEHDGGYRSAYLHLQQGSNSRIGLKVGDTVNAGELIGYSGNSGWSTGPHLHVEVHKPTAGGYFGQTVPFVIGGDAAGDDDSISDDSATDNDSSSNSDYDYDEEDDSLPIGQLIANEVVALTRESLKGLNQAIADGIRSQFDGIISPLQNKVDEAEKKVANLKSQLESKTDGIIDSISGSVIGGLNATAKNELRNAINEVTDGDFLGGATSVTQAVLAKLSSIGLGFVAGLIEGWVDDRINEAFAPVEEALKTANQALQSAKEELHKVNEVVQEIIDQAIDAAADQINEWTPYIANLVQALFYAGEEWVNNLTNPEFWMNPELWKKFAEFVTGLLITAIVSFIAGAIAGAIGTAISAAGLGTTIPAGVATAVAIFATIMGALIGAYMSRDELMALYESAKTAFTNLNEGAKSSTTDEQLQFVGERFASEYSDALGKLVTIVANIGVGAIAGGVGAKVGSSITSKLNTVLKAASKNKDIIAYRQDSDPYSNQGTKPDRLKSSLDADGNIIPANPNGKADLISHIRGSEPAKSNSPYTSFKLDPEGAKSYGDITIKLNLGKLRQDIANGKIKNVKIVEHDEIVKAVQKHLNDAKLRYNEHKTPKNLQRIERAQMDLENVTRDKEILIEGIIPLDYVVP